MTDRERALLETYRAEALALLQANQAARNAAERVAALLFAVLAITVAAGINAGTDDTAIALPPLVLTMLSYLFQQYADLTVLGAARAELEDRVAARFGGEYALIYERAVAPVRKHAPLGSSLRLLEWLIGAVLAAIVITGTVVAFDHQPGYIELGFSGFTLASLGSAAWSYRAMRTSFDEARVQIRNRLAGSDPA